MKWKEYRTLVDLKREVQAAVGDELIKGYRAYGVSEGERAGLQEHVQGLTDRERHRRRGRGLRRQGGRR